MSASHPASPGDDFRPVSWPKKSRPDAPCEYAASLSRYSQELSANLRQTPARKFPGALLQAKAQLLDRYALCKAQAPAGHTNAAGKRSHPCVVAALDRAIDEFDLLARNTLPPPGFADVYEETDDSLMVFGIELSE